MHSLHIYTIDDIPNSLKKIRKEKKFCQRITRLVKDVEGAKPENLKDAWRWIKGLLHDFVQAKE